MTSEAADASVPAPQAADSPAAAGEGSLAVPDGPAPDRPTAPAAPSAAPSSVASTVVEPAVDPSPQVADSEAPPASPPAEPDEPPAAPTPTLSGFVAEKLPNHEQQNGSTVLGDWILMLSFFSEVLNSFGGGLPRTAIYGTHIPERAGEALTYGSVRVANETIEIIAQQAPLGTVVRIVE